MKVVAVSMRAVETKEYVEDRDAVSHDLIKFLEGLEVLPVLVPNCVADVSGFLDRLPITHVLLSGGGDVAYGRDDRSGEMRLEAMRDRVERGCMDWAIDRKVPVLGICRGAQAINCYFGGHIVNDIQRVLGGDFSHVASKHQIQMKGNWASLGEHFETNSFHMHGISKESLSPSLSAFALSADGGVEAFEHREHPIVGVMWHPERSRSCAALDEAITRNWLGND